MNPELALAPDREAVLDEVVTRYLKAAEAGSRPDPDAWLARYPDLQNELAAFFADQRCVEQIAAPLRALAQSNNAETVAYSGTDPSGGTTPSPEPALDDYEVLEELGRGGMGVVYRAHQRSLNRVVALKMILAGPFASRDDVARFRSEAEAAASLDHPNIVPVYGSGEVGGQPYFTMRFVEGTCLAKNLPPAPRALAELLVPVARAVHYAHQRGILHRDLKPSNILLGADGRPHVTDFGLARRIESAATFSGRIAGTPTYMAPEQAAGAKHLTTAVDVYGLGAVLYEGLTGQPPFRGETMLAVLDQVRDRDPVKPRALLRSIPNDLETICLKCLHKDPSRRYPSADALADDLERFLAGEPVRARRTGPIERVAKWSRRRPALAALSVAVVVLVATVIGLLSTRLEQAVAGLGEAEQREEKLKVVADERDRTAKLVEATLCFEKGSTRLERGDVAAGLLWLTRGLELAPEDAADLRAGIRRQLGAGAQQIHPLRGVYTVGERPEPVYHTAFSPDGKVMLMLSKGTSGDHLWLREAATGKPIGNGRRFQFHVAFTAFRPDGKEVVVGSGGHLARIDTTTGKRIGELIESGSGLACGAFLPDGKSFFALGIDRLLVYTTDTWGKPAKIATLNTPVVVASPDGQHLILIGPEHVVIYSLATLKPAADQLALTLGERESIYDAKWTSDGKAVLVIVRKDYGHRNAFRLDCWVPGGKRKWSLDQPPHPDHSTGIYHMSVAAGGRGLYTVDYDNKLRKWDEGSGRLVQEAILSPGQNEGAYLTLSPDGRTLLPHSTRGRLMPLRDAATLAPVRGILPGSIDSITPSDRIELAKGQICGIPPLDYSIAFSPDGRSLLVGCHDDNARLYDIRSPSKPIGKIDDARMVGFTDDGKSAFVVDVEGKIIRADGRVMSPFAKEFGQGARDKVPRDILSIWPRGLSPSGRFIVYTCHDQNGVLVSYRVFDLKEGITVGEVHNTNLGNPRLCSLSADGKTLLVAHPFSQGAGKRESSEIRRWDVVTGKQIGEPIRIDGYISERGLTPDRKTVLVEESSKESLQRYDVETGKRIGNAVKIAVALLPVAAFAPDGKSALMYSATNGVRMWDLETGKPRGEPLQPGEWNHAFFSPDGRTLATITGQSWDVRLWDAATLKPLGPKIPTDGLPGSYIFAFSPDSKQFAAIVGGKLRVFDVPQPLEGSVEHIRLWVEVNTGKELDAGGALLDIEREEWLKRWERLHKLGGPLP